MRVRSYTKCPLDGLQGISERNYANTCTLVRAKQSLSNESSRSAFLKTVYLLLLGGVSVFALGIARSESSSVQPTKPRFIRKPPALRPG